MEYNPRSRMKTATRRAALVATLVYGTVISCASPYALGKGSWMVDENNALILPKGPYQRYIGPGEIKIGAQLPEGTTARLIFWKEGHGDNPSSVPFKWAWDRLDYAHLIGLEPGEPYWYRVSIGEYSTRTYPLVTGVKEDKPFRFLVFGDTKPDQDLVHAELVRQTVGIQASFYIHTGDYVRRGDRLSDWRTFFRIEHPLLSKMPILPVVGNHDTSDFGLFTGLFLFEQHVPIPKRYYSSRFGNTLVIVLDTQSPITIGDEQYNFLNLSLESAKREGISHIFIAMHKPIYSSGKHGGTQWLRASILPLIEQYSVTAVFSGHDHHYERSKPINGIVHVISGGGGAGLTELNQRSYCARAVQVFHYVVLTVDGKIVKLKAVNLYGKIIDEVRIK